MANQRVNKEKETMRSINTQLQIITLAAVLLATVAWPAPASADFCIQLNGGSFSGDLGFFRFKGSLPTKLGKIEALTGRVAGLSPAFGTATVTDPGSKTIELAATFFADGTQGQFDVNLFAPFTSGSGDADYGDYGTSQSVNVTVVDCSLEP
jgi:hypothetical protein